MRTHPSSFIDMERAPKGISPLRFASVEMTKWLRYGRDKTLSVIPIEAEAPPRRSECRPAIQYRDLQPTTPTKTGGSKWSRPFAFLQVTRRYSADSVSGVRTLRAAR